jgi:hypothetical protein
VTRPAFLSSIFMDYETPSWFLDLVRQVGPIVLDPSTAPHNPTGAQYIYTPPSSPWDPMPCGLSGSWAVDGLVYSNPRYGRFLSGAEVHPRAPVLDKHGALLGYGTGWAAKMAQHQGEGLYLVPARPDTAWWLTLYAWCDLMLLWSSPTHGSRIHFHDPRAGGVKRGSNLPSTVFYRGPRLGAFVRAFEPHGTLLPGSRVWHCGWA